MTFEISVEPYTLPLSAPLRTGAGVIERRRGFAIQIEREGTVGIGEASPLPGWTESYDTCRQSLERAEAEWARTSIDNSKLPTSSPAARHGLGLAGLDAAARDTGRPLSVYLAGEGCSSSVPVNAIVGECDVNETVAAAEQAVVEGFSVIKCKVGSGPVRADIERLRAVDDAIDEEIELRLDANRAWSPEEAGAVCTALSDLPIQYLEEPVSNPSPGTLDRLSRAGLPIALDETLLDIGLGELDRWLEVVEAVVLKPMALGGIDRALAHARAVSDSGVTPVVSTTVDAVIARTAAVHLAAALPTNAAAGLGTAGLLSEDLAPDPAPVTDGAITVPRSPGIGTVGPWPDTAPDQP